ncbi:MAG: rubredoxin [Mycoplasma sp.]
MEKYTCELCGYVYDEAQGDADHGIKPGTKFQDLPADFMCPLCGAGKESFTKQD